MNASSLTIFDWALVALLATSVIRAFLRGFLLEVLSIVGLIAGVLLAGWYYADLAAQLTVWLKPLVSLAPATASILAFFTIFLLVMVLAGLTGKFLRSSASAIGLGLVDRCLGAGFGLVRGCLLGIAGITAVTAFAPGTNLIAKSQLLPYFLVATRGVSFVVPEALQQRLTEGTARIKHNKLIWIKPLQ